VESRAPSSLRLFVALELPDEAREAIVAWQHDVFGGHGRSVRLVRPDALHVTLAFLGHHPESALDAIRGAAFSLLGGVAAPSLTALGVGGVPPRRPRLWALDLDDPGESSTAVHEAVAAPLVEGGWYEREKRPFWPHVTVARVRAREKPPRLSPDPPEIAFVASEVVLYRSRLSRAGADYEPLARFSLVA
jgi:2'-5' RNA ligase